MPKTIDYLAREEQCRALAEVYSSPATKASFSAAAESWKYLRKLEEDAFAPRAPITR